MTTIKNFFEELISFASTQLGNIILVISYLIISFLLISTIIIKIWYSSYFEVFIKYMLISMGIIAFLVLAFIFKIYNEYKCSLKDN